MEVTQLEEDAKRTALKHVAELFKRPEQLAKVDVYKKRTERKLQSVEAMLKLAVQSQLDGAKTALQQLDTAADDLTKLKGFMDDIGEQFIQVAPAKEKLGPFREHSLMHSQYVAAMQNLSTMFKVPETIDKTRDLLKDKRLLHVHKNLIELERARDDLLFEMHRLEGHSQKDMNLVERYFQDIDKITNELKAEIFWIMDRLLDTLKSEPIPVKVVTAVRIIEREERFDHTWEETKRTTGFCPPDRPRRWRQNCLKLLKKKVNERVESQQKFDRSDDEKWLIFYLEHIKKTVTDDLSVVKSSAEPCFPKDYDIFMTYVNMYHEAFSDRLIEIVSDGDLNQSELFQLLHWIPNDYCSPQFMGRKKFDLTPAKLKELRDTLLPPEKLDQLTESFTEITRNEFRRLMEETLKREKNDWYAGKRSDDADPNGITTSSFYIDLFSICRDQVHLVEKISKEMTKTAVIIAFQEMIAIMRKCRESVSALKGKYFELMQIRSEGDAENPMVTNFLHTIIAMGNGANRSIDFGKAFLKQRSDTVDEQSMNDLNVLFKSVKNEFLDMMKLTLSILYEDFALETKDARAKFFTKSWISEGDDCVSFVCDTLVFAARDYKTLLPSLYTDLIERLKCLIVGEYVKALESKRLQKVMGVTTKVYNIEERRNIGNKIEQDVRIIQSAFSDVNPSDFNGEDLTEFLKDMCDIVTGSDTSLISLELSSFVRKYAKISTEQLLGLLALRDDVARSELLSFVTLAKKAANPTAKSYFDRLFDPATE